MTMLLLEELQSASAVEPGPCLIGLKALEVHTTGPVRSQLVDCQ